MRDFSFVNGHSFWINWCILAYKVIEHIDMTLWRWSCNFPCDTNNFKLIKNVYFTIISCLRVSQSAPVWHAPQWQSMPVQSALWAHVAPFWHELAVVQRSTAVMKGVFHIKDESVQFLQCNMISRSTGLLISHNVFKIRSMTTYYK